MSTLAALFFIAFIVIGVISVASIPFFLIFTLDDDPFDDESDSDRLE